MARTEIGCMRCGGPLADDSRAGKQWVGGSGFSRKGRLCKTCHGRSALGSLIYAADVCHAVPCHCGWCEEYKAMKAKDGEARP
jgi:hypothetical protein